VSVGVETGFIYAFFSTERGRMGTRCPTFDQITKRHGLGEETSPARRADRQVRSGPVRSAQLGSGPVRSGQDCPVPVRSGQVRPGLHSSGHTRCI